MIQKFKSFDSNEYLEKKNALREAAEVASTVEDTEQTMEIPENDSDDIPEDEVIFGKPVYSDPYLLKISHIVGKKLEAAGLGNFGVAYNIVYLNDVPGVRFYDKDGGEKCIICCRDTNGKSISIFNSFIVGEENTAVVTYTTKKLGFKDMLDELISDLKGDDTVNEGIVNEAVSDRYGSGWT